MHQAQQTPTSNNTKEDSTHGHHQTVDTEITLITFFATKVGEALHSQQKTILGAYCGSDHELTYCKIQT